MIGHLLLISNFPLVGWVESVLLQLQVTVQAHALYLFIVDLLNTSAPSLITHRQISTAVLLIILKCSKLKTGKLYETVD